MKITVNGKTYKGTRLEIKEDRHIYLDEKDLGELDDTRFTGIMCGNSLVMNQPQKYLRVVK
jgi:hypothetical protein